MSKVFNLFVACLLVLSTTAFANNTPAPYTVTFTIQNNSSHNPVYFGNMIPGGSIGWCDSMSDKLVCTSDQEGRLHQILNPVYQYGSGVPLTISNVYPWNGKTIFFGSMSPMPKINLALTNDQWDGTSNLSTTLIITDNNSQ